MAPDTARRTSPISGPVFWKRAQTFSTLHFSRSNREIGRCSCRSSRASMRSAMLGASTWTFPILVFAALLPLLIGSPSPEEGHEGAAAAVASRRVHAFFYLWCESCTRARNAFRLWCPASHRNDRLILGTWCLWNTHQFPSLAVILGAI